MGLLIDKGIKKNLSVLELSLVLAAEGFDPLSVESIEYDIRGWNLLHYAAYNGKLNVAQEIFKLPIEKTGGINDQSVIGWTPLHLAVFYNRKEMVGFLIDQGANIGNRSGDLATPLDLANTPEKSEIASLLRTKQSEYDRQLFAAIENGDISKVTDLLNRGADIEAKDKSDWAPLHYAAMNGQLDAVRLLVTRGANILAKDRNGKAPLDVANEYSKTDVVNFLKERLDNKLFVAVRIGNVNEIAKLLDGGANIEAKGTKNETPLCVASNKGDLPIIQLLVSRNANVNVLDSDGITPLHHAAYSFKGVEVILGKGADIEAKDKSDWAPLHYVAMNGQLDAARLLTDRDANIRARTNDGKMPLDIANEYSKSGTINLLQAKQIEYDNKLLSACIKEILLRSRVFSIEGLILKLKVQKMKHLCV